jgi:hypothetical protein
MPLVIVLILTAFMGMAMIPMAEHEGNVAISAKRDSNATRVFTYLDAVRQYRMDNQGVTGSIADASITFPSGASKPANWSNTIFDGRLWVYETVVSNDLGLMSTLSDSEAPNGVFVGRRTGSTLETAMGYPTGMTYPASVPVGAIVLVTR